MTEANGQSLPPGWVAPAFSEIVSINPPLDRCLISDDIEVAFVPMRAVESDGGGMTSPEIRRFGEVKKGYTAFLSDDVIMAKITPCMENGKTTVVPDVPGQVCFGSTEFHVLRPEQGIQPKWIAQYLLQHEIRRAAQRQMSGGVGQMRVPAAFFETVKIPVPPATEQIRIIDTLEELFSDLDAAVAALNRAREKLRLYRASVLEAAVEGTLVYSTLPFVIRPISEAIESMRQGWSPKCENAHASDSASWAVIKTTAIQPLRFLEEQNKRLPSTLIPRPSLELNDGDLLVTRAGPRRRVGVACMVKRTRAHLMLCDKVYRLQCKPSSLSPPFLEVILNAPSIVDALDKLKTGINDSGVNLTQERFGELLVPFPSREEQVAIAEAVEDQLSVIEHLEADLSAKLKSAQGLRQSILRHAFTGQLVPQDPNDEPASVLLKCITADREARAAEERTLQVTKKKPKGARVPWPGRLKQRRKKS